MTARLDHGADVLFHAPGYLAVVARPVADAFAATPDDPRWRDVAAGVAHHLAAAERRRRERLDRPFAPTCLTLYLNGECTLRCAYCFAVPGRMPGVRLTAEAVGAAARLVAATCRARATPMTVALHGGGEPVLHPHELERLLGLVEDAAARARVPLLRYVATNGVMSAARARWLAGRVDLVGLSHDGTPDLQDAHRPTWGGGGTSGVVERTARILRTAGTPFHVRVTLTPDAVARQEEIADHLCAFGPTEIHVEPVYRLGRAAAGASVDPGVFSTHFLAAREVARTHGVAWETSGSRPGEVHGPYCHVLRDVLQLVPGDVATTCFTLTDAGAARAAGLVIGWPEAGRFRLDHDAIARQRAVLSTVAARCAGCVNEWHCAGTCPEGCPLTGRHPIDSARCAVLRALGEANLRQVAGELRRRDRSLVAGLPLTTLSVPSTTRRS